MRYKYVVLSLLCIISFTENYAVEPNNDSSDFEILIEIPNTSVKNQYRTSTCWSFSTISFIESELLRSEKKNYDLSEMYIVRNAYINKAKRYVRMHGALSFTGGGEPNDVINIFGTHGILTEKAYSGLLTNTKNHVHLEMDEVLKNYVDSIIINPNKKLELDWLSGFEDILDLYLGAVPQSFTYEGEEFDANSFSESLKFNPNDYILLSSFTHHLFYKPFVLEVPDNWSWGEVYNLPIAELEEVANHALESGYSMTWSADYSEKGFLYSEGIAVVPRALYYPKSKKEEKKISRMQNPERRNVFSNLDIPIEELQVTQRLRQDAFDNYTTTDDHGMHIVGKAKDKNGKLYYYVKNSWGTENKYGGYFFVSEAYFQYKTISIMLHKNAIPMVIRAKLGL